MSLSVPSAPQGKKFHCFVCGVIYENKERTRVGIFDVPKTKLLSWQEVIPELKPKSRLCDSHFHESDINKGYTIGETFIPAKRWKLSPSAQPLGIFTTRKYYHFVIYRLGNQ